MSRKRKIAALALAGLLPLLLGGCFTIDVKIPMENGATAAVQETQAVPVQETQAAAPDTQPAAAAPQAGGDLTAMSQAEQLAYFNDALNRIKANNVGFKKSKLTATEDITLSNSLANSLVGIVKGALLSETAAETTVNKGENSNAVMSPYNVPYVSQLTMDDITGIEAVPDNGGYVITVRVKGETNPEPTGSICSRIFEFMTVDDVETTYAPKVGAEVAREDIEVVFNDCFAKATIDADGNVTGYETFVKGTMNLRNAKIKVITTDVSVVLASTTTYTDFKY
ncbi:MAG: hypothetical protein IJK89_09080 [Clostridia bacterium]|nr:hypothetical protein [Clostridia bacterium]